MDLRKSIFRYLHSVFNTDPNEVPILSVSFSDELDYRIHETTLTLGNSTIDLTDKTIGEVDADIRALGHAADLLRPDLAHRHAVSLVDTHGTATGVLLHAQDSELWAVGMQGALEFLRTREAMEQALRQLNFMQANGGWIDLWGKYFDVPRLDGQDDRDYSAFIRREVLRTRSNGLSIQVAVKDWTSKTVIIREPWRELWIWDKSRFDSADARWQDGNFYTFGTIEPRGAIPESGWADITPVIQRNRSMGCYLLPHAFGVEAPKLSLGEINVGASIAFVHSSLIDASLDPSVAVGRHQDSYMTITLAGESSVWVGSWDSRTWSSGGRTYPVGYSRTDIPV